MVSNKNIFSVINYVLKYGVWEYNGDEDNSKQV
jgi:hypothetical protein